MTSIIYKYKNVIIRKYVQILIKICVLIILIDGYSFNNIFKRNMHRTIRSVCHLKLFKLWTRCILFIKRFFCGRIFHGLFSNLKAKHKRYSTMKFFDNQHKFLCVLDNFNLCAFYLEQLCYQISFSLQVAFFIRMGLIVIIGYFYFLSFFFPVFYLNYFKSFRRWFQNSPNTTNVFRLFEGENMSETH